MNWISIKDKLPDYEQSVLICFYPSVPHMSGGTFMEIDRRINTKGTSLPPNMKKRIELNFGFTHLGIGEVTHWMPLPDMPEINTHFSEVKP